mgnify:CR=1 FL=1
MSTVFNIVNAQANTNTIRGTFSLLVFLYGVFEYIKSAEDPEERKTGQSHMLWGIIGLAIMFSAYGIIYFVLNTMEGISYGY